MKVKLSESVLRTIQKAFRSNQYEITGHCQKRMMERNIAEHVIKLCGQRGTPLELQFHGWDFKIILYDKQIDGRNIYIVTTISTPSVVITACNMESEVWEDLNGLFIRKK
ncbi:MAG: DUF4258 domain-containing protein [Desulfitobacterium hafniense]|nr:DUF4258 domain-containing protein [Desulfitobacterium hafniense]